MRFFEYEAREIVKRAGIPVTDYGFTKDEGEAREIAERIGGPVVIKSQVLTGGRMKAGGVKFADTSDEAERHARQVLQLEINGHHPLGELEDGSFVALDAHMEMENEARPRQKALLHELGVGDEETRQAREATEFELKGEEIDAQDHRGVAGNVTEFDGDLGLVIGAGGGPLTLFDAVRQYSGRAANYCEIRRHPQHAKASVL